MHSMEAYTSQDHSVLSIFDNHDTSFIPQNPAVRNFDTGSIDIGLYYKVDDLFKPKHAYVLIKSSPEMV